MISSYPLIGLFSRVGVADTCDAEYSVSAANSASGVLNASNNDSEVLKLLGIAPDALNEILISVVPGPGNDNGNGFFYIGLMEV